MRNLHKLPRLDHQRTWKETYNPHHKPRHWPASKEKLIFVPYVPCLSEEFRRIFHHTNVQVIFKDTNTLHSILMHGADRIPLHLKQNIVYKWSCADESCTQSCIGKSSRCLENRVWEHSSHITSAVYICSECNNHPHVNISNFKLIDQDRKQFAREAIHIWIINMALSCNTGKLYILEIFNSLLGADRSFQIADFLQGHTHLTIPRNRLCRAVCLANWIARVSKLTQLRTFLSPISKCQVLHDFAQIQK